MDFFGRSRLLERLFLGIIFLTLWCFAYYFTVSDLDEVESRYTTKRTVLVKLLAREITDLINRREEIEPRLANLMAEEAVVYAIVQQPEGEILAQVAQIPVETLQKIELEALKVSHLRFFPFNDSAGIQTLIEGTIPLFSQAGKKVILRIGFNRTDENERSQQVWFRNALVFSTLLLGLLSYWLIRRRGAGGLQSTWLGMTGLLILILFLASRMTIQSWYERSGRQNFVQHGISLAKFMAIPIKRFLQGDENNDLREMQSLLEIDENYVYMGVIKDEQYLYHSDPYQKGKAITDPEYAQILNSDKPFIYRQPGSEIFEAIIPVIEGQRKLGTFQLGFRNASGFGPLSHLRNQIVLIFLSALILSLFMVYLLSRRISKDISLFIRSMEQVTAGDLRQSIYLDRDDEFGQMAQAYNFMLMGLKERDLLSKGLQNYVSKSIVDKTLKVLSTEEKTGEKLFAVVLFVYFDHLNDALTRTPITQVFGATREVFQTARKVAREISTSAQIQMNLTGTTILFTHSHRHESVMQAIQAAQGIILSLQKIGELPIKASLALHCHELLHGALDDDSFTNCYFGESVPDFRFLARVQEEPDHFIVSEETSFLLKEVSELEEIGAAGGPGTVERAYVFKGFKAPDALIKLFPGATPWNKILILKLLKGYAREESVQVLLEWFADPDPEIRSHIMDALERLRPPEILDFIVKTMTEEKDSKVLSKAIRILGKIGGETHISLLAEKLRINDRRVKANCIEALEAIGGKKVYEFLNLLVEEQDNRVKANILIALGKYGDLRVFDLLSRMIKDPDRNMRASAAFALGKLGMIQGVEPLIAALSDKDISVRRQVVASLTSLKADLEIDM
jgi:methyl-accepting chemotaxis protein